MANMTRQEHLDWCKSRALEYLNPGKFYSLTDAVASMMSDLTKHPETALGANALGMIGVMAASSGSEHEVRKFIEGFN